MSLQIQRQRLIIMAASVLISTTAGVSAQSIDNTSRTEAGRLSYGGTETTQGVGLSIGKNTNYRRLALSYETSHFWEHRLSPQWGELRLSAEFGAAYWEARRVSSESMGQVTAALMLKWWATDSFYIELGTGPTLLSRSEFAQRKLSTRFQFGSNIGAGITLNKKHRLGVRYSHYSNANLKKPNQGLDIFALVYEFQF